MICCLPFTYYSDAQLRLLGGLGETLEILFPTKGLVCEHMQPWVEKDALTIKMPSKLDERLLKQTLVAYRNWAELNQGNLDTVAAFFKSNQSPAPLVDETDPTQIRTQIRRFGESDTDRETDGLLHAALFIAMAHDYDAHPREVPAEWRARALPSVSAWR